VTQTERKVTRAKVCALEVWSGPDATAALARIGWAVGPSCYSRDGHPAPAFTSPQKPML
jgi:hypothetical protein